MAGKGESFLSSNKIRAVIAEDHLVVSEAIMLCLEEQPDIAVARVVASGRQALRAVLELEPEVLLLDLRIPDMDGLQVLTALTSAAHKPAVLVLTSFASPANLTMTLALGAAGFLSKDIDLRQIPRAIRTAASGMAIVDGSSTRESFKELYPEGHNQASGRYPLAQANLTAMDIQMLSMLADGMRSADMAAVLLVSERTVRARLSEVYTKIGVNDRTQAALWAVREGIVAAS